jgi:lysophospholipase L1-like esterase
VLTGQSRLARAAIGASNELPLNADGVYQPDGSGPHEHSAVPPVRFAVFGDSSAAGLGVDHASQLPGVLLARGLAGELGRPVRLVTYAINGSTSRALAGQIELGVAQPADVSLVMIGANDVKARVPIAASAGRLVEGVRALRNSGSVVVVATCPDLGIVRPIRQPLRSLVSTWSLRLARAQRKAAVEAGAIAVPMAELASPEFFARPHDLFSADRFHPNAHGYHIAATVLLGPLCTAARLALGTLAIAAQATAQVTA